MKANLIPNRRFADSDKLFQPSYKLSKVPPTKRQASKFRRGLGLAYLQREVAGAELLADSVGGDK